MSPLESDEVLALRVAGEQARLIDLSRLLPHALPEQETGRRARLGDRLEDRQSWLRAVLRDEQGWEVWHDSAGDTDRLVDELVALLMTQLLRCSGIDAGTFDAADALLAELAGRADVAPLVLGQTQELESIDHTRASVSLRFPGSRVWDLPFLSHEFGHHAVAQLPHLEPELAHRRPLDDVRAEVATALVDDGLPATWATAHGSEFLADAVATVVCGPTYPVACLCLRVPTDAATARRSGSTHPSWWHRVALMRHVLDELSEITGRSRYRQQRQQVVDQLAGVVLGGLPTASPAVALGAAGAVAAIRKHRPGLIYEGADTAIEVEQRLRTHDRSCPRGASVTAVLDGAWRWRLSAETRDEDDDAAARVAEYCRQVAAADVRDGDEG